MQQATPKKPKARAPAKKILLQVIRAIFDFLMGGLIAIGVLIIAARGFDFPTILFQIGAFKLIGLPFSYVIFGAFGFYLDRVFKWKAPFMLLLTYATWDLIDQIAQSIIAPNSGGASIPDLMIWTIMIVLALYIVRPRLNFNHWISLVLFAYYANLPFLERYMDSGSWTFMIELVEQIIWVTFIGVSFYKESDDRGMTIREFIFGHGLIPVKSGNKKELQWYSKNDFSAYSGQWIALIDHELISHGPILKDVVEEAKKKSNGREPFYINVPGELMADACDFAPGCLQCEPN